MESEGPTPGHQPSPGEGGNGCCPCIPDRPLPGVWGGGELEESPVESSRWETLWNEGPLLKGCCKHPSCSVNTKLDRSQSWRNHPAGQGGRGWGTGAGGTGAGRGLGLEGGWGWEGWGSGDWGQQNLACCSHARSAPAPTCSAQERTGWGHSSSYTGKARRQGAAGTLPGT